MPPEERLELLCDPGSLRVLRAPGGRRIGVVAATGEVDGRPLVCYAHDSRLQGGSVGIDEAEVVVRALRRASRTRVPVVAFLESAGARLQEGAAALGGFGRIFSENVALQGRVPQISVITGTSAGGGCYSPALTDFIVMTHQAAMFLTGPQVVHEVLGEQVDPQALGGAGVHSRNGVCHLVVRDEPHAAATTRELLGYLPSAAGRSGVSRPGIVPTGDPGAFVPASPRRVYDVRDVVGALVDDGRFLEVGARWARNLVVGLARVDGRAVGIVANQPRHLGGVLDVDASQKGARFVSTCDAFGVPLVVLVDTPGFMPGLRQEAAGVIRHGAALLRAFAAARVPRLTVILRKAYGGAYITMNSRDLGADRVLAWPGAEIGVMGPRAAIGIIHRRELAVAAGSEAVAGRLAHAYAAKHLGTDRALALGLVDEVVAPEATRARLSAALCDLPGAPRRRRVAAPGIRSRR